MHRYRHPLARYERARVPGPADPGRCSPAGNHDDRIWRYSDDDVSRIQQRFGTLSAREQQVMMMVTTGKMNKQVAGDLGISEITVKIHRGAAMRKMGARTLADLVRMAEVVKPKAR